MARGTVAFWDHWGDAARSRGGAIDLAGIAFVAQCGAWGDVRAYVEQGLEASLYP